MLDFNNSFNELQNYKNEFNSNFNTLNNLQKQWKSLKKELKEYDNTATKRHVTYDNKAKILKLRKDIKKQLHEIKKNTQEKKLKKDNNIQQSVKILHKLKDNVKKYNKKYVIIDDSLPDQQNTIINEKDYEEMASATLSREPIKDQKVKEQSDLKLKNKKVITE